MDSLDSVMVDLTFPLSFASNALALLEQPITAGDKILVVGGFELSSKMKHGRFSSP